MPILAAIFLWRSGCSTPWCCITETCSRGRCLRSTNGTRECRPKPFSDTAGTIPTQEHGNENTRMHANYLQQI